jgi:hypothetical protein
MAGSGQQDAIAMATGSSAVDANVHGGFRAMSRNHPVFYMVSYPMVIMITR